MPDHTQKLPQKHLQSVLDIKPGAKLNATQLTSAEPNLANPDCKHINTTKPTLNTPNDTLTNHNYISPDV